MDGSTFNKIAGAVLGTVLFGFFVIEVSHWLYPNPRHAEHAEVMGYPVPGMEAGHGGGETEVVEEPDLPTLLASADIAAGEAQFRACGSCHNDAPGAAAKVGPNLWGVVGRAIGGDASFNYSGAMAAHGGTWTFDNLFHFLESPSGFVPGTAMSYRGMRRAGDRANLIAYLNQQSPNPLPLPEVTASEPTEAATEAAGEASDAMHDAMDDAAGDAMDAMTDEGGDTMDEGEGGN
jgi:cytochrome c